MTYYQIRKELHSEITDRYVHTEEYQDRYYFTKLIHKILPNISEKMVANAVEKCNLEIKTPREKRRYLKRLSEILTE